MPKKKAPAARAPNARRAPKPVSVNVKIAPALATRYDVRIGSGLVHDCFGDLVGKGGATLLVIDHHLPRAIIEPLLRNLDASGVRWAVKVIAATEADKSLHSLHDILVEAGKLRLERGDAVIALGGGIVTDLAGFAAAVYRRGVRVIQCPTTLLAMVDAAVGGKTGANLSVPGDDGKPRLIKNLVGAFHQPARVVCDITTLQSLPLREFRCGLAECVKHALLAGDLGDRTLLPWMEKNIHHLLEPDRASLRLELVRRNTAVKAKVVARDERETTTAPDGGGGRMKLNLGHTFAHAIETLPGLSWHDADGHTAIGPLKHGEAVGLGLLCATRLASHLKLCEKDLPARVEALLARIGLPRTIDGLPVSGTIIDRMRDDKKTAGGKLRLVLPVKGAKARVMTGTPEKLIAAAIDSIREKL